MLVYPAVGEGQPTFLLLFLSLTFTICSKLLDIQQPSQIGAAMTQRPSQEVSWYSQETAPIQTLRERKLAFLKLSQFLAISKADYQTYQSIGTPKIT